MKGVLRLAAVVTVLAVLAGCAPDGPSSRGAILISIDTLRADHLGCYGYDRDTSPMIDAFARDAILFTQAIAQAPSTLPSHASMLSSLLPSHHGAYFARRTPLPEGVLTVAEVLREAGFRTASFNGGGQIDATFGLLQGFEVYESESDVTFGKVADKAITWLESLRGEPFFLFLHSYEVHHPYTPRKALLEQFHPGYAGSLPATIGKDLLQQINRGELELSDGDLDYIVSTYDAEIRAMDEGVQRLLDDLVDKNLYDSTTIVFTSDHGEEFGEHGQVGWHSHTLYDELLRVPLIVKLPRSRHAGTEVSAQVRLLDVAPTLLDALGVPVPAVFQGTPLQRIVEAPRATPFPAVSVKDTEGPHSFSSLRFRQWKWIQNQLFDLKNDPGELRNVASEEREIAERMSALLEKIVADGDSVAASPLDSDLDEELQQQLRTLGYVD